MTIKNLLIACIPELDVRIHRIGQMPDHIKKAVELFAEVVDQPDERVRYISVSNDVLIIGLYSKKVNNNDD